MDRWRILPSNTNKELINKLMYKKDEKRGFK